MGDPIKAPTRSELKNRECVRKSLVAHCDIRKGDVFTTNNIIAKRPGFGISPMKIDSILGQKAKRDFKPDELIEI
jgi:N,N'-diacetyllegionaminate synthase